MTDKQKYQFWREGRDKLNRKFDEAKKREHEAWHKHGVSAIHNQARAEMYNIYDEIRRWDDRHYIEEPA